MAHAARETSQFVRSSVPATQTRPQPIAGVYASQHRPTDFQEAVSPPRHGAGGAEGSGRPMARARSPAASSSSGGSSPAPPWFRDHDEINEQARRHHALLQRLRAPPPAAGSCPEARLSSSVAASHTQPSDSSAGPSSSAQGASTLNLPAGKIAAASEAAASTPTAARTANSVPSTGGFPSRLSYQFPNMTIGLDTPFGARWGPTFT